VRPSVAVFDDLVAVVKRGDFDAGGWGGTSVGGWWGGATFQGVVPYYYAERAAKGALRDGAALEVDRCVYNNMVCASSTLSVWGVPHWGEGACTTTG
jgi:hypothetical protein